MLVLLTFVSVERGGGRVEHRGALLGPEESGPAHRIFGFWGLVLFLLGHGHTDASWCDGWLGPALTKPLVWVSCSGCVVSLEWGVCSIGGGSGLVFLPVF